MSESSSLRSLPTNDVRSILVLAIASSSSDFDTLMRMAMAFLFQPDFDREFPPLPGTLTHRDGDHEYCMARGNSLHVKTNQGTIHDDDCWHRRRGRA